MYEGKEVIYINSYGEKSEAIVVACVRGIGITIVNKNDKEHYHWCLKMKNSPKFVTGRGEITYTNKLYSRAVKGIKSGVVDINKIHAEMGKAGGGASSVSCAFN